MPADASKPEDDSPDRDSIDRERALTTPQAGELLGLASITLQQQRARGEGPRFFRVGRSVRYRLGDVIDYREAHAVGKRWAP